jgi:hypothetical protein
MTAKVVQVSLDDRYGSLHTFLFQTSRLKTERLKITQSSPDARRRPWRRDANEKRFPQLLFRPSTNDLSVTMSIGISCRSALWCSARLLASLILSSLEFAVHPQNVLSTQQLGAGSLLGSIADCGSLDTSLEIEESFYLLFYPMRKPSAK